MNLWAISLLLFVVTCSIFSYCWSLIYYYRVRYFFINYSHIIWISKQNHKWKTKQQRSRFIISIFLSKLNTMNAKYYFSLWNNLDMVFIIYYLHFWMSQTKHNHTNCISYSSVIMQKGIFNVHCSVIRLYFSGNVHHDNVCNYFIRHCNQSADIESIRIPSFPIDNHRSGNLVSSKTRHSLITEGCQVPTLIALIMPIRFWDSRKQCTPKWNCVISRFTSLCIYNLTKC